MVVSSLTIHVDTTCKLTIGELEKMGDEVTWTCVGLHYPPSLPFTRLCESYKETYDSVHVNI